MNKLLLPIISLVLSFSTIADESPFSIALGQKTLGIDMDGYKTHGTKLESVFALSDAIYAKLAYNQTPYLSYSFEYTSFMNASSAGRVNIGHNFNDMDLKGDTQEFKVKIKPNNYLSVQAQYTFRVDKTVRPYLFTGLSYISSDITHEYIAKIDGIKSASNAYTESDTSTGILYGAGLDIRVYNSLSFIFDYRIQQDIAGQPADEVNAALKYRF